MDQLFKVHLDPGGNAAYQTQVLIDGFLNDTVHFGFPVVYAVGLDKRFHGVPNPASSKTEHYAESVFRALEESFAKQKANCVGMYLKVRRTNERAIRFYQRIGFCTDETAVSDSDLAASAEHLVMRKVFGQSELE